MYKRTRSRSSNAIPQKRVEKVKLAEEPVPGPSGVAKKSPPTADLKRAEVTKIAETAGNVTRRKMEPSIFDEQEWEKSAFKKKQSTKPAFHAAFNDSSVTCDFLDQEKAQSDFFQILQEYRMLHRLKNNVNESVDRMPEEEQDQDDIIPGLPIVPTPTLIEFPPALYIKISIPVSYPMSSKKLNIPRIGLGQAGITENDADELIERTVEKAVEIGYRHFDTAYSYMNEVAIGNGLKRCLDRNQVTRQELWVITKLPGIAMHRDRVEEFLRRSLKNLQMDYVDTYLVHWPIGYHYTGDPSVIFPSKDGTLDVDKSTDLIEIWKAMEGLCDLGLTRTIGLSNFNSQQIDRILGVCRIPPSILQVELNVSFQQPELVKYCHERQIIPCAYAPLGSLGRIEKYKKRGVTLQLDNMMQNPVIQEIAEAYGKTSAQIMLRFLVQQDIVVIPKTTNFDRLYSNFDILDFDLLEEDMEKMRTLDKGPSGRTYDLATIPIMREHPEFPF
ncbi:unnamed protein product [Allacma fusca]|uniref:NADP-dependent oxidoreductase domain-containing protein n=1 Tax=Allacma fusca TaxID=39272 RepID=A0A8J2LDL0_9HEXA|nr:unnamed protein product [Allacma fusca]